MNGKWAFSDSCEFFFNLKSFFFILKVSLGYELVFEMGVSFFRLKILFFHKYHKFFLWVKNLFFQEGVTNVLVEKLIFWGVRYVFSQATFFFVWKVD